MEDRRDEQFDDLLDRAAEALCRAPVPPGPPPEAVARVLEAVPEADVIPLTISERIRKMKPIAKIAVAATVLVAIGILVSWLMIGGGSTNIAFAEVAKALDSLRTATYDVTMEMKNPMDGKTTTTTMKGFFLAPSRERIEMSMSTGSAKDKGSSIMILDHQAMKGLTLAPEQKLATTIDLSKIKKPAGPVESVRDGAATRSGGEQQPGREGRVAWQEGNRRACGHRLSDP